MKCTLSDGCSDDNDDDDDYDDDDDDGVRACVCLRANTLQTGKL
jgi:hypothetical protein